ncbi:HAMP domain-containing histidine kinase [bacterium]|nr:HAMP domain-containing histidine kinase [bacterium]MDD6657167.1 HAMP domain-containing sensor histidine kinase [Lachnospiraceae bacterium]MDY3021924.1 HAMP domain-containing sensor histidine kinase [Oliverpabstia sp.]MDY4000442.1 HAMP domain-containing sensor histidine kinase [Blautia sp.]
MMKRKKRITIVLLVLGVNLVSTAITVLFVQNWNNRLRFHEVSQICQIASEIDPNAEDLLLTALKKYHLEVKEENAENEFLLQHGYDEKNFSINGQQYTWGMFAVSFAFGSLLIIFALFKANKQKQKRIEGLTEYLEYVNTNGTGTIMVQREDDFSLLQDEISKTVTALCQVKEDAIKAKENYSDNLANIAHQLKTPITAAEISIQILKQTCSDESIDKIERQLLRLTSLEEALLKLSRIDSGTLDLEYMPIDCYTVLNLAADNMNDLLIKKHVKIDIQENGCAVFMGDMEWTMEALMNLLKNCMEHTPFGGTVHCRYSQNPIYTEIVISDEGEGFTKEDLPHIFERFYRGKSSSNGGIGIGLSISKAIFEMQNGNITAKNLPDGGACYEIRIYRH